MEPQPPLRATVAIPARSSTIPALVVPAVATTPITSSASPSASSAARSAAPVSRWSTTGTTRGSTRRIRSALLHRGCASSLTAMRRPRVVRSRRRTAVSRATTRAERFADGPARDEAPARAPGRPASSARKPSTWFSAATAPAASNHDVPCSEEHDTIMSNSSAALVGAAGMKARNRGLSHEITPVARCSENSASTAAGSLPDSPIRPDRTSSNDSRPRRNRARPGRGRAARGSSRRSARPWCRRARTWDSSRNAPPPTRIPPHTRGDADPHLAAPLAVGSAPVGVRVAAWVPWTSPSCRRSPPCWPSWPGSCPTRRASYEPKWDGFRCIVFRDGDEVELGSRNERPLTRYFPELIEPIRAGPCRPGPSSTARSSSPASAGSTSTPCCSASTPPRPGSTLLAATTPASFVAFDLLALDDEDLRAAPFGERRGPARAGSGRAPRPRPPDAGHRPTRRWPRDWFSRFEGAGLDGVVAKRADLPYREGERRRC